ncbi:hypothetical protein D3C81_1990940 [compost metagenome]
MQRDYRRHVASRRQLGKEPFGPVRIARAAITQPGKYPGVGHWGASQKQAGVLKGGMANNRADSRLEHIRIHSKCGVGSRVQHAMCALRLILWLEGI